MGEKIRTGVVGVGNFGTRHAEKYASLPAAEFVAVADTNDERAREVGAQFGVDSVRACEDLIGKVDAVSIAVPTAEHYDVARLFLENGVHVLVEKPIADVPERGRALSELADQKSLVLQVGHIERYSPIFEALREIVKKPLFIEGNRISVYTGRSIDVNVVLDLMIHDIDLLIALVDSPVKSVDAVGAPVVTRYEDIANTRLHFENGCAANITASRISHKVERNLRIFQADEYTVADLQNGRLIRFREKPAGDVGNPLPFQRLEEPIASWDNLEHEIDSFLNAIIEGVPPRVTGWDATEAVRTAAMIEQSLHAYRDRLQS